MVAVSACFSLCSVSSCAPRSCKSSCITAVLCISCLSRVFSVRSSRITRLSSDICASTFSWLSRTVVKRAFRWSYRCWRTVSFAVRSLRLRRSSTSWALSLAPAGRSDAVGPWCSLSCSATICLSFSCSICIRAAILSSAAPDAPPSPMLPAGVISRIDARAGRPPAAATMAAALAGRAATEGRTSRFVGRPRPDGCAWEKATCL